MNNRNFERLLGEAEETTSELDRKRSEMLKQQKAEAERERRQSEREAERRREMQRELAAKTHVATAARTAIDASLRAGKVPARRLSAGTSSSTVNGRSSSGVDGKGTTRATDTGKPEKRKTGGFKRDFLNLMKEAEQNTKQATAQLTVSSSTTERKPGTAAAASARAAPAVASGKSRKDGATGSGASVAASTRPGSDARPLRVEPKAYTSGNARPERINPGSTSKPVARKPVEHARSRADPPPLKKRSLDPRAAFALAQSGEMPQRAAVPEKKVATSGAADIRRVGTSHGGGNPVKGENPRSAFQRANGAERPSARDPAQRTGAPVPTRSSVFERRTSASDVLASRPGLDIRRDKGSVSSVAPKSSASNGSRKLSPDDRERNGSRKREADRDREDSEGVARKKRRATDSDDSRRPNRGYREEDDLEEAIRKGGLRSIISGIFGRPDRGYHYRDVSDDSDMEADSRDIRREELRSARLARKEDERAAAELERDERERAARKKARKGS